MHRPFVPGRSQRLRWLWEDIRQSRFSPIMAGVLAVAAALLPPREGYAVGPIDEILGLSLDGASRGWLWQLFTHALVHGGTIHLGVNLLMLVVTGARVERIGGWRVAAAVFVAGVLTGGLAFLILMPGQQLLVGASGGIFALLLWITTVSPESRMAPLPLSAKNLGAGILMGSGTMAVIAIWWTPGSLPVAHACHFGGAIAGRILGRRAFGAQVTLADLQKERARRESGGGLRN